MGAAQLAAIERFEIVGGDWINRQVGGRAMLYLIPTSRGLSLLESDKRHRQKEGYQSPSRSHQRRLE
jgi:hypothetical protein